MIAPLLLTLAVTFLTAFGGRDQRLVAMLRGKLGRSIPLLSVSLFCAALTACAMAWAGWTIGRMMSDPYQTMLVVFIMLVAALDLCRPVHLMIIEEPTRSLGALLIVLLLRQIGDGTRLLILAIAVFSASPAPVATGGAIGGGSVLLLGWRLGGNLEHRLPPGIIRSSIGALIVTASIVIAFIAIRGS